MSVSTAFKQAIVRLLLKKAGLDINNFKNYCLVSNLSFVLKIIKKVVASRIEDPLDKHKLHDNRRSAYRSFHSTVTVLLRVHHDLATVLDNNSCSMLVMLDLSAAFNVSDNGILRQHLEYTFGISRSSLSLYKWQLTANNHWFCFVGFPNTHNWCTPRFSVWTETILHIFETNWRHLWKPQHGLPLLCRWYLDLHRSRVTWQLQRYVHEAHVLPLQRTRVDVFKLGRDETWQNRAYDFCSNMQGEGTDRF